MKRLACFILACFCTFTGYSQVVDSLIVPVKFGNRPFGDFPAFDFGKNGIVLYGQKVKPKYIDWASGTAFEIYHLDTACKKLKQVEVNLGEPTVVIGAIRNGDDLICVIKVGDFNRKKGYIVTYNTVSQTWKQREFKVKLPVFIEGDIALAGNYLYIYEYPAFGVHVPPTMMYIDLSKPELELTSIPLPAGIFGDATGSYGPRQVLSYPGIDTVYFTAMHHPGFDENRPYNLTVLGVANGKLVYDLDCGDIKKDKLFDYMNLVPAEKGVYFYSIVDESWNTDTLKVKRIYINNKQRKNEQVITWASMSLLPERNLWKSPIQYDLLGNYFYLPHGQIATFRENFKKGTKHGFVLTRWENGKALSRDSVVPFEKEESAYSKYGCLAYCYIDTVTRTGSAIFDDGERLICYSVSPSANFEYRFRARTGLHRSPNDALSKVEGRHDYRLFEERFAYYLSSHNLIMLSLRREKTNGPLILRAYKLKV